jgi:hypothetical protein
VLDEPDAAARDIRGASYRGFVGACRTHGHTPSPSLEFVQVV